MAKARVLEQLTVNKPDIPAAVEQILTDPRQVAALIEALQSEKGAVRFACEKVLRLASERRPEMIYPYFDVFAALLDCDNSFVKWGAIMTLANLTVVDAEGKFEAVFARYYAPVAGPMMITAANVIASSPRIARAKPHLAQSVTREILKVEKARYERHARPSPECRNVAIGHAIDAFRVFFDLIEDKAAVLAFVHRQLANTRRPVVKKAERFLRAHGNAGKKTQTKSVSGG
jgi:hypothetical protein